MTRGLHADRHCRTWKFRQSGSPHWDRLATRQLGEFRAVIEFGQRLRCYTTARDLGCITAVAVAIIWTILYSKGFFSRCAALVAERGGCKTVGGVMVRGISELIRRRWRRCRQRTMAGGTEHGHM